MSYSTPEPPSPCHLPSTKAQICDRVENVVERPGSPPQYGQQQQNTPLGQARKRAIAVLIVLTNLVPVRLPIAIVPILAEASYR